MASRIKGITVEIGGNTTKLQTALKQVNSSISSTQSKLRDINNLLKLDPTNTELLTQKQGALQEKVTACEEKLKAEKDALAQLEMSDAPAEETERLKRDIIATEQELKKAQKEAKSFGSVAQEQAKQAGVRMEALGKKIETVGSKFKYVSAAAAGILAGTAIAAANFEDQMAKVSTIADTSVVSLEDLSDGVLEISNATGKSSSDLSEALYQALSASVETGDSLEFLSNAANLAKAGFLDTADAVDVLTTIINAYGMEAEDAEKISDVLIQTQNDGKTTVNELAASMGQVIPTASALGVNLENLSTAYILMTKQGINTANSTTYINGMLNELADSGSTVAGILKNQTGKTFGELMSEGKSLGDILSILNDSVSGNSEQFLNLWGNMRAGKGALALINGGTESFNEALEKVKNSSGNTITAVEELSTSGARARKALNELKNTAIKFGQTVLDMLSPVIEKVATAVDKFATWFDSLSDGQKKAIAAFLGITAAISPCLKVVGKITTAFGKFQQKFPALSVSITNALSTAKSAVTAFMGTVPGAIVAGAAVIGIAIAGIYSAMHKYRNEVSELQQTQAKSIATASSQVAQTRIYAQELEKLLQIENKTNAEKELMATYVEKLNGQISGLNLTYDVETDKLNQSTSAIYEKIDAYEAQTMSVAYLANAEDTIAKKAEYSVELAQKEAEVRRYTAQANEALLNGDQEAYVAYLNMAQGVQDTIDNDLKPAMESLNDTYAQNALAAENATKLAGDDWKKLTAEAKQAGITIPQEFIDALEGGLEEVPTTLEGLKKALKSGGYEAGTQLGAGVKEGINGSLAGLAKTAANAVSTIANAMKKAGKIHSPSRLTRDLIGKNLAKGVAVGLQEDTGLAERAGASLVSKIASAMLSQSPSLASSQVQSQTSGAMGTQAVGYEQIININQPVDSSPSAIARAIRNQQIMIGLAGA